MLFVLAKRDEVNGIFVWVRFAYTARERRQFLRIVGGIKDNIDAIGMSWLLTR
jgi:hypothetical protein